MRLRADIWVSAYIRRVEVEGRFATLRRRGAPEAGAIFVLVNGLIFSIATAIPTTEDYRVKGLEKYGATGKAMSDSGIDINNVSYSLTGTSDEMHAGHMPLTWKDNTEGSHFFWLAVQRSNPANRSKKLVVWLNGGPVCSSMIGMMHENGPFKIEANPNFLKDDPNSLQFILKRNPYSWNKVADVLYVEQPIRTGFSRAATGADATRNTTQMAADFRHFLLSFMEVFTHFQGWHFYYQSLSLK